MPKRRDARERGTVRLRDDCEDGQDVADLRPLEEAAEVKHRYAMSAEAGPRVSKRVFVPGEDGLAAVRHPIVAEPPDFPFEQVRFAIVVPSTRSFVALPSSSRSASAA